jgi:ribosomal subunit interface protein
MQIQVVNKGIDVSEALRERIQGRVDDAMAKFTHRPGEAFVVIEREGFGFRVDCSIHLPSGALLQSRAAGEDAYSAAEVALDRLEKRLRRYKRRLVNRRAGRIGDSVDGARVAHVVLKGLDLAEDESGDEDELDLVASDPVVVAESSLEAPILTVGMAVLELELANAPVLIFRNAAHGALNVVFRRPDGHIGWIDPERGEARASAAS